MELKRILANDLRAATEKAIRIYGPNTLVVSSERITGGVEVIVATDFSSNADLANPPVNSADQQNKKTSSDKSLADELAKDSFDEILYDSIGKTRTRNSIGEKGIRGPGVTQYVNKRDLSKFNKPEARNDGTKSGLEPTLGQKTFHDSKTWSKENNLESFNEWEMEESSRDTTKNDMPLAEKKPFSPEEFRARELVDRVLQEMAEMKKEFKLAKKMIHNEQNSFSEEITDFIEIVKSENLPLSLQTLLLDDISKFESMREAFENIFSQLIESTKHVKIFDVSELKGTNIFAGPSGSGKTSMIMKTIQQFAHNVVWGELDYLLIDLPPGTGDAQLSLAQILPLDGALIVTTPQKAAVDVARRGARMFEKVNVPILGVVENMSYLLDEQSGKKTHLFGQGGGATTAQSLKSSFLGEIPLHEEVRLGGDHGTPVVVANPDNPASRELINVAEKLAQILS